MAGLVVSTLSGNSAVAAPMSPQGTQRSSQQNSLHAAPTPSNNVFKADGEWPQPVRCGRHIKPACEKDLDCVLPGLPADPVGSRVDANHNSSRAEVCWPVLSRNLPLVI